MWSFNPMLHIFILINKHICSAFSLWVSRLKKLYSLTCVMTSFLFISVIMTYYSYFSRFGTNPSCKPAFSLPCFIRCWKINFPLSVIYSHISFVCLCRYRHMCLWCACVCVQSFVCQKWLSVLLPVLLPWLRSHAEPHFHPHFEAMSPREPGTHQFA